nr:hypothetical protein [Tanacetum cinerariifolium]
MNYLEEQTDGEAMIYSIQNGDHLLPVVAQIHGFEYGEQDRKARILYEYETFKATEGEQLLDTYLRYLQVINDLKKCGYKKINYELNYKFLNNLQPEWKQYEFEGSDDVDISDLKKITALLGKAFNRKKFYAKPTNNNLKTSSASSLANKKPEYVKSVEKKQDKKADEKKRDMSKVKCYNCKKEGHFAKDCKKSKSQRLQLLQDKDVNTFEEQNNEFNEQMKVLNEKNADLLAQIEVLQDQVKIKHVEIDNHIEYLDTFSSVRRPKQSSVIWKKKGSSNTSNVVLSYVSHSKLNKDVKRYSRKDLLSCNNSHLGETSSAYVYNDAMNVSCNSRLCDSFDENNLFIFDDESVRISPVSKMHFRKKPRDSLNVCSKSNSNKSLPRTVHRWLSKMKLIAKPVDKWIPKRIVHMMGNRALLTNFVEKFLGTVRFGNNDFAVIDGYGDVVIGSMTIKKVYYVKGLGHNLFSVGQFWDSGLEVAISKSTFFVLYEDFINLFTGDRSSNLYTNVLNKVASNSSACLLAKYSSLQS